MFYPHDITSAAKHIGIKYFVVKNRIQDQTVDIVHINTTMMLADPLTKGLQSKIFNEHVAGMGLMETL
jgi:hypothetical protein